MTLPTGHPALAVVAWALRPDPTRAREWLSEELSRPAYQESPVQRFERWFGDLVDRAGAAVGRVGSLNPVVAVVLLVVLVVLLALLLSRLRGTAAVSPSEAPVFARVRRTAQEHRRAAALALEEQRWDDAVVEAVRALAAGLVERGLAPEQADVTVHEVVERAAGLYPSVATRLRRTGVAFDETRYGDRPADGSRASEAVALELETSRRPPERGPVRGSAPAVPR